MNIHFRGNYLWTNAFQSRSSSLQSYHWSCCGGWWCCWSRRKGKQL